MNEPWFYVLWAAGAYVLGSISAGYVVARAAGVDISRVGTGNPGAANIFREIGPAYGAAVFAIDITKGAAATVPLLLMGLSAWGALAATGALLAGQFRPFLWRFPGSTGMAAGMGATLGLLPAGALIAVAPSVAFVLLSRNVAYTGVLFFIVTAAAGWLVHEDAIGALAVLLTAAAILARALYQYRGS